MPEGDTIFRAAATLDRALAGKSVRAFRARDPRLAAAGIAGATIERVEPRGKNLLIWLRDGRVLHTHLRMHGAWHLYRPGERWQKPERQARVVIEVDGFTAVCFNAPVTRLLTARAAERDPALAGLGPDAAREAFDPLEAARRLAERGELTIGEALLVQGALAGIGNVLRSLSQNPPPGFGRLHGRQALSRRLNVRSAVRDRRRFAPGGRSLGLGPTDGVLG